MSVLAVSGLQFDLSAPRGKMIASVMAALAEFERDLIRERIKSGIAAAKARGKRLGRQPGQRPSDRKAKKVLKLAEAGLSYRLIGRHVGLSKNTVGAILQRARAANQRKQASLAVAGIGAVAGARSRSAGIRGDTMSRLRFPTMDADTVCLIDLFSRYMVCVILQRD